MLYCEGRAFSPVVAAMEITSTSATSNVYQSIYILTGSSCMYHKRALLIFKKRLVSSITRYGYNYYVRLWRQET